MQVSVAVEPTRETQFHAYNKVIRALSMCIKVVRILIVIIEATLCRKLSTLLLRRNSQLSTAASPKLSTLDCCFAETLNSPTLNSQLCSFAETLNADLLTLPGRAPACRRKEHCAVVRSNHLYTTASLCRRASVSLHLIHDKVKFMLCYYLHYMQY